MIIDFRIRPPYKSFMRGVLHEKPSQPADPSALLWSDIDKEPVISAQERSMDLFLQEMVDCNIGRAVIMGRKADEFGIVDNAHTLELVHSHPETFIPFAGVNPHDPDMPEVIAALAAQGFRGVCLDGGCRHQREI